jgi:HAE1 family hydrophobic/amphiphilic exporter-1
MAGYLARKVVRSAILVGVVSALAALIASRVPSSFVPEEDQGYLMVNAQLPDAASLERSDNVAKKIAGILGQTPGVESYSAISGFSLLTNANSSNMAFVFVQLKPWHERHGKAETASGIIARLNQAFATEIPEGITIAFGPPAIPGLGNGSGFSMMLQDLGGNTPNTSPCKPNGSFRPPTSDPRSPAPSRRMGPTCPSSSPIWIATGCSSWDSSSRM